MTGLEAGESTLQAVYARPWEFKGFDAVNFSPMDGLDVKVTIEAAGEKLIVEDDATKEVEPD